MIAADGNTVVTDARELPRQGGAGEASELGAAGSGQHVTPGSGRAVTPDPKGDRRFRPDIEGLRAVAVGTVVVSHAGVALAGGYVGVDVFFVISGYLITRQLHEELSRSGKVSFAKFYARRARRILPAAVLVIIATLLASWAWLSPLRMRGIAQDAVLSAVSGVNWRLAVQGTDYFQSAAPPSPLQHYWSLAVEEQFYVVWPLLLMVSALALGKVLGRRLALISSLSLVIAVSCYLSVTVTKQSAPWAYFGSHTRAWELAIGAVIAVTAVWWSHLSRMVAVVVSWLGLAGIGAAAVWFDGRTPYPGSAALLPVVGAAMVIVGGCSNHKGGAEAFLRLAPMQFVGRLSYSLYLWHWPVLMIMPAILGRTLTVPESLGAVAASVALSYATFRLVEQPIRARRSLVTFPGRGIALGLGAVAASVAVAVFVGTTVRTPGSSVSSDVAASPVGVDAGPLIDGASRSVNEAVKVKKLPAVVTPALDKVLKDRPDFSNCLADIAAVNLVPPEDCHFGDRSSPKRIVLMGDSHAFQWSGLIRKWVDENHWQMWIVAKAGCSAGEYPHIFRHGLNRDYTECATWRSKALPLVRSLRPTVVVLSSHWLPEGNDSTAMEKTVTELRRAGTGVLYFTDTPSMDLQVPDCLAVHTTDIGICNRRVSEAVAIPGRLGEIKSARAGGAEVFDPIPWFCTKKICPALINDVVVYRDESHVTNTFVMTLYAQFDAAIRQVPQK